MLGAGKELSKYWLNALVNRKLITRRSNMYVINAVILK